MKNEWFVIEVEVVGRQVELVSAILGECGSQGTLIEERRLDTFQIPDDDLDPAAMYTLKAYFTGGSDAAGIISELKKVFSTIPALVEHKLTIRSGGSVADEDWAENWKQNFSSLQIGQSLVVCPSWETRKFSGRAVVEIDPGMAFGTGSHGTTRLCLEFIAELMQGQNPPLDMLDVGTGSGILALGAAALGCPKIVANDLDAGACSVARENIRKNEYTDRIKVSDRPLEQLPGHYELVVANILAEENVRLKNEFIAHLSVPGWLLLSGILREKEGFVGREFSLPCLRHVATRYADDWVAMLYRRQE